MLDGGWLPPGVRNGFGGGPRREHEMKIFGSSGTRGVVAKELTPSFVLRVAQAAGTVWEADRAVVSRDTRTSGEMFENTAVSGLASVGLDVDRLGVAPTPAVVRYCEIEEVPAVHITASHNPPEYNGVKLVGDDGVELTVDVLEQIEAAILDEEFDMQPWDGLGAVRDVDSANRGYIDELLASVDREAIADAELTVALDPGHGAGTLTNPELFRRLGCTVVTVNATPDGRFPGRQPEPVGSQLTDLSRLVEAADADVGIAHDGDADRAVFVDERGEFIDGESSLAALAAAQLSPGDTFVSAVNVSQRVVDAVADAGATLELTPIGSTNIITHIRRLQADGATVPVAGEGNGGVFFPNYRLVRDGAYTGAKFLELVADRPASDVVAPFSTYHTARVNLRYDSEAELTAMLDAAERYAEQADVEPDTVDGYRLDYGDAWVLVRPSGTEPVVRVYAEARDAERAEALASEVEAFIADGRDEA
jgi:phosphomannomutase/phosphoglucomutase